MKLPAELREKLLLYAIPYGKAVQQMPEDCTTNDPNLTPVDVRLFAANKYIKNESEPMFYKFNTF